MNKTNLLQGESQESESVYDDDSKPNNNQLDKQLKYGPLRNRKVRDRICIGLFFMMWLIMLVFCGIAHYKGDLRRVINPYNSKGEQCGIGQQEEYQYVYIIGYQQYYCVKDCPGVNDLDKPLQCLDCNQVATYESQQGIFFHKIQSYLNNFFIQIVISLCIPSITDRSIYDIVVSMVETGPLQQFWGDIKEARYYILFLAFIAFLLCLNLFAIMGKAAWCIVWGMITLFILSLIIIGVASYIQQTSTDLDDYKFIDDKGTLLFIQWTSLIMAIIFVVLVCALIRYINFSIAFLKAAGAFMSDQCQLFILPIISFGMILGMFTFWLQTSALIYSTGDFHRSQIHPYNEFVLNQSNVALLLFYFFGLIFNINFFISFTQFITASTCCFWYFKDAGADISSPLIISIKRGVKYHLGSIILGAFILSIVWTFKLILEIIYVYFLYQNLILLKKIKYAMKAKKNQSEQVKCCVCYYRFLVECFVKHIRYLNYNAFIMIALTGRNFCSAGIEALCLLLRSADRVYVTHHLGGIIEFIGSLFVTAGMTTLSYYIFTECQCDIKDIISSPTGPMIIVGIVSYMIGRIFMGLYAMGVDCILLCYLADCEVNDGAQHTPPTLRHFFEEHQ